MDITNQQSIKSYYDDLAPDYNQDRFQNTYGQYIDSQERSILKHLLSSADIKKTLEIACGTGRFLEYAHFGLDISPKMLQQAQLRYPNKLLFEGSALSTPFKDSSFSTIYSFHLIMHLDREATRLFLSETARITDKGGRLIFDFPSVYRRQLIKFEAGNWHAANSLSVAEIQAMTTDWLVEKSYGILFFPIHRIPNKLRKYIQVFDNLICRSFLKKYASYNIIVLKRR